MTVRAPSLGVRRMIARHRGRRRAARARGARARSSSETGAHRDRRRVRRTRVEALQAIQRERPDVLFLDVQMPGVTGFELLAMMDDDVAAARRVRDRARRVRAAGVRGGRGRLPPEAGHARAAREDRRAARRRARRAAPTGAAPGARERAHRPCLAGKRAIKLVTLADVEYVSSSAAGVYVVTAAGEFVTELTLARARGARRARALPQAVPREPRARGRDPRSGDGIGRDDPHPLRAQRAGEPPAPVPPPGAARDRGTPAPVAARRRRRANRARPAPGRPILVTAPSRRVGQRRTDPDIGAFRDPARRPVPKTGRTECGDVRALQGEGGGGERGRVPGAEPRRGPRQGPRDPRARGRARTRRASAPCGARGRSWARSSTGTRSRERVPGLSFEVTKPLAAESRVGVTEFDWALAETGTLVQDASDAAAPARVHARRDPRRGRAHADALARLRVPARAGGPALACATSRASRARAAPPTSSACSPSACTARAKLVIVAVDECAEA